jgi:hypothetical protein
VFLGDTLGGEVIVDKLADEKQFANVNIKGRK